MIGGIKPYPRMRDPGIPWLGQVPEHWAIWPGKACYQEKKILNTGMQSATALSLSYGKIVVRPEAKLHGLVPESFETYQIIDPGDIVVRATDLQNDRRSLRFGLSSHHGIITSAYMCLNCRSVMNREYGHLLLHAYDLKKVFYGLGSGLRQNLDWSDFKCLPCLVPPYGDQAAIVRFLDWADRGIGRAIRARRRRIKLLEEYREAIIHRAVTGQIDVRTGKPYPIYRPSGVEWLGEVPDHWEIIPCRYLFRAITRRELRGDEVKFSVTQRNGLVPTELMEQKSTQAASLDRFQVCIPGDLVLNKYKAHLGVFWAVEKRGLITPNYTVFRPARELETRFYEILFHTPTYRDLLSMAVYGVTEGMSPLYSKDFYKLPALFPPRMEQSQIVQFVDARTLREATTISHTRREIELLSEYRTRLIADVVTGKVDVREIAAMLPEEPEGPETEQTTEEESLDEMEGLVDDESEPVSEEIVR